MNDPGDQGEKTIFYASCFSLGVKILVGDANSGTALDDSACSLGPEFDDAQIAVLNIEDGARAVLWTKAGHSVIVPCVPHGHVDGDEVGNHHRIPRELHQSFEDLVSPKFQGCTHIRPAALEHVFQPFHPL
jgi:hypothetical protein